MLKLLAQVAAAVLAKQVPEQAAVAAAELIGRAGYQYKAQPLRVLLAQLEPVEHRQQVVQEAQQQLTAQFHLAAEAEQVAVQVRH